MDHIVQILNWGGLTWGLLYVPIMCMRRAARPKVSLRWQDLRMIKNSATDQWINPDIESSLVLSELCLWSLRWPSSVDPADSERFRQDFAARLLWPPSQLLSDRPPGAGKKSPIRVEPLLVWYTASPPGALASAKKGREFFRRRLVEGSVSVLRKWWECRVEVEEVLRGDRARWVSPGLWVVGQSTARPGSLCCLCKNEAKKTDI